MSQDLFLILRNPSMSPCVRPSIRIRIYNIDEAWLQLLQRAEHPDDPCRTPVGLRILGSSSREEPVLAYSSADPLLKPERNRSVRTDTRKLWVWGEGVYRNNNSSEWRESNNTDIRYVLSLMA